VAASLVAAKEAFDDAPAGYTILGVLVLSTIAFAYWKFEYSGFSGSFSPLQLLQTLNKEDNVLVVDVRQEDEVEAAGVIDLKGNARGKAASLPLCPVCPYRTSAPCLSGGSVRASCPSLCLWVIYCLCQPRLHLLVE
jgi:rhodanese-related sulfurtransferase